MGLKKNINFYKNKRVLITGHTGFKGSWMSSILDSIGAIVTGYSLEANTNPSLFELLTFSNNFKSVIGDIRDLEKFKNLIKDINPDFIFHLAAQPLVIQSYQYPKDTFDVNFTGTLNLLEILKELRKPTQVIFITTDKVYENLELGKAFKESDRLGGKDPYSASKAASEILISSYRNSFFKDLGINIATARAGNVIGGGDWSKYRLFPDIINSKIAKKSLIIRNPEATRPWQHVLEPIFGYLKLGICLYKDPVKFSTAWNFGPEIKDILSVNEIIEVGQKLGSIGEVVYKKGSYSEAQYLMLDIKKAKKELGFKPIWNAEIAIQRTFNWYNNFYFNEINVNQLIKDDVDNYLKKNDEKYRS